MPLKRLFTLLSNQKGVLFGMDARVALVVFSVLVTAAIPVAYNEIKKARVSALIKELTAVEEALEQYKVDMGTFMPFSLSAQNPQSAMAALWKQTNLLPTFQAHWQGPYMTLDNTQHTSYGTWGLEFRNENYSPCSRDFRQNCYVWITLSDVNEEIWLGANSYFDEASGEKPEAAGELHTKGKFRADVGAGVRTLYMRSVSRL